MSGQRCKLLKTWLKNSLKRNEISPLEWRRTKKLYKAKGFVSIKDLEEISQ